MTKHRDRQSTVALWIACLILGGALLSSVVSGAQAPRTGDPGQTAQAARCRIEGRVTAGSVVLPGASIVVRAGGVVKAATSSDADGKFAILFAPNSTYHVSVELTAFGAVERDVTVGTPPCDTTIDIQLALAGRNAPGSQISRGAPGSQSASGSDAAPTAGGAAGSGSSGSESTAPGQSSGGRGGRGGYGGRGARGGGGSQAAGGQAGGGAQAARGAQRFEQLDVQANADATTALDLSTTDDLADAGRLLPAGFSLDAAQASAVALTDNGDATTLDRGALNNRLQAIGAGQFDPTTGQFAPGLGPDAFAQAGAGAFGAPGQAPGAGGPPGGRGGPPGGRGGGPGGGGFFLGGRGARGQSPYQGSVNYTFGGSMLNAVPFQLNPTVPSTQPQFAQNTAGFTIGGPFKIPGIYKDTNRRSNFQANYQGNRSDNVFDQYATVPTAAMRAGDFSSSAAQLVDPTTGLPFAGNQIPLSQMNPAALQLLPYIPAPNLPGNKLNYHVSTLTHTSSDALSLRFIQNLSPTVPQGGGRGGGRGRGGGGFGGGGFGGGGAGRGGPGGRGPARGTSIVLNAQLQYRRNEAQSVNIFPDLGGTTTTSSLAAPIALNIVHGRTVNNITVQITHATTESTNAFAGVQNVAGDAGIQYPTAASSDPLNWGVPNLSFSGFTGVRPAGASSRTDNRITTSYVWSHPVNRHQLRAGVDFRFDNTTSEINPNPRGTFTYTGLYSTGGIPVSGATGSDFADFLLGVPQQATLQVGGVTHLNGRSFDTYIQDNWQKSAKLTFNLGLRYELALPYVEENGQMANLDAAPGFTAVSPVYPNGVGAYTGAFPAGLINADRNNIGPRVGVAYRVKPSTILRGGYSITYNPGSYATVARQLVAQPPFSATETVNPTALDPTLQFETALLQSSSETTNNFGVDKNYALGQIQTWNATVTRNLNAVWSVVAGYTGIKGTDLDLLSAPNRTPSGLLIPTVQPFTWESSNAHSIMNSLNLQLLRRLAHGVSGSASYTLSKSMDDSPSLGGGSAVEQDPNNLAAEWALSNFDRRHQFTGNLYIELPFGQNRRWLHNGGFFGNAFGDWATVFSYTAQSGTPLTANVVGNAGNVFQGASGALRANYTGAPITLVDPTTGMFFNTAAFALPAQGTYGNSLRNMIPGPPSYLLNAQLVRDIRLGGTRALTLNVNATNLLNTELYGSIGTNINSPQTFGQVLSLRPARAVTINARVRF